jgi:hypothetical protein
MEGSSNKMAGSRSLSGSSGALGLLHAYTDGRPCARHPLRPETDGHQAFSLWLATMGVRSRGRGLSDQVHRLHTAGPVQRVRRPQRWALQRSVHRDTLVKHSELSHGKPRRPAPVTASMFRLRQAQRVKSTLPLLARLLAEERRGSRRSSIVCPPTATGHSRRGQALSGSRGVRHRSGA